jgi:pimeloyl-[acyl-carrier protein] methyl ester esterase
MDALGGLVHDVVSRTTATRRLESLWIGWSLGGIEAMARAAGDVDQDDTRGLAGPPGRLVLIASTARFCRDGEGWPGTEPAVLRGLQGRWRREPAAALAGFHTLAAGPTTSPETVQARTAASLALDPLDLARGLDNLARWDVRPLLSRLHMPVLVVHGRDDRIIPSAAADRLAEMLPRATRCDHPTAGHDLPLAEARWTADRIVDFLGT